MQYEYLRMSGCDTIEGVDDARDFQVVSKVSKNWLCVDFQSKS